MATENPNADGFGEVSRVRGIAFDSLFAIGLTLFAITLLMNIVSDRIAARYREEY